MRIGITLTSSLQVDQKYLNLTKNIASKIAKSNHGIVYGGTDYGMMHELANSYVTQGGKDLIGVMAESLIKVTKNYKAFPQLTHSYVVPTMEDRKNKILELSDAYLILPGGYGTFEEIGVIVGGKVNKIFNKPICFLNIDGFYNDLLSFFNHMHGLNFSKINVSDVCLIESDFDKVLAYFESYVTDIVPDKFV